MNTQPPNLVFVFPDEMRQQALGSMKQDPVITPNLDQFATESLVLTQAVSNCPICSPYRGMLFTGQYPLNSGVPVNINSDMIPYGVELSETKQCFSDILHDTGYSQGYIGKLHLDLPQLEHAPYTEGWRDESGKRLIWDAYTPPGPRRHGYDFWYSYGCCDQHLTPHYWTGGAPVEERILPNEWSVKHETDVAIEFIFNRDEKYRDREKPFSLFVSYNPPHMPFDEVPPQYLELYADLTSEQLLNRPNVKPDSRGQAIEHVRNYFAAISGIDEQFGRILQALDEAGLKENTIVIFTSDHGEMMGSHGLMGKSVWYDESFLVPFIIRWPGYIPPGWDNLLFGAPDIMPTLLGLMGFNKLIPDTIDGTDYAAALLGEKGQRPQSAFYILTHPHDSTLADRRGVRTDRYIFVVSREGGMESVILHDNQADPFQLENIAEEQPVLVDSLKEMVNQWLIKTGDTWAEL